MRKTCPAFFARWAGAPSTPSTPSNANDRMEFTGKAFPQPKRTVTTKIWLRWQAVISRLYSLDLEQYSLRQWFFNP